MVNAHCTKRRTISQEEHINPIKEHLHHTICHVLLTEESVVDYAEALMALSYKLYRIYNLINMVNSFN